MSHVPVCDPPCEDWPLCRHRDQPVATRPAWKDRHGDVWVIGSDGLLHTRETRPFPRELVERKWGPLTDATGLCDVHESPDRWGGAICGRTLTDGTCPEHGPQL